MTVFIPTNAAFEAIASTTATLTQTQLQQVLTLHVLSDAVVYSPSIPSGTTPLPTVNGEDVTVVNNGTITIDQATVIAPNVILRNGAAHVIDRLDTLTSPPNLSCENIKQLTEIPLVCLFQRPSGPKPVLPRSTTGRGHTNGQSRRTGAKGPAVCSLLYEMLNDNTAGS